MTIVADVYEYVAGVDTHAKTHTVAIIEAATSKLVGTATFPATASGMRRALAWITRRGFGAVLMVIEGIGSYGAQIARLAADNGLRVVEPMPTPERLRRGRGKTDPLDAQLIARSVTGIDVSLLRQPRRDDGYRAALRVLLAARDNLNTQRTSTINALTALVRVVDLGVDARKALTATQVNQISAWRARREPIDKSTARGEAARMAKAVTGYGRQLADNKTRIASLVTASLAAPLLHEKGVGPITAAIILVAWSHPGRVRNEAAFAALAGACPIPASSGNTSRYRLNHGGDRRLNWALHCIANTRLRCDPDTIAYAQRRTAQGLSTKDIRRILKRYIARQAYRILTRQNTPTS
jgi:transposase